MACRAGTAAYKTVELDDRTWPSYTFVRANSLVSGAYLDLSAFHHPRCLISPGLHMQMESLSNTVKYRAMSHQVDNFPHAH